MKLPKLEDLEYFNNDDFNKLVEEEKDKGQFKEAEEVEKFAEKERARIPKTEYDANTGNPVLAIPDLDDIELNKEIDKYLSYSDVKGGK